MVPEALNQMFTPFSGLLSPTLPLSIPTWTPTPLVAFYNLGPL